MSGSNRHAWIDATAGVAGDMLLGALIDAGADLSAVQHSIDTLLPGAVRLDRSVVTRAGQRAARIHVEIQAAQLPRRTWRSIREMLRAAPLADPVRRRALAVFARLAQAEAEVHDISVDDVHFHEVGALDSIADIVGVCAALHELGVDAVSVSAIALGAGRVRTEHGDLPVPVPAVLALTRGWRVHAGGTGELATPTGVALITTLAATCEDLPPLTIERTGVGGGARDTPERPNITRVVLGHPHLAGAQTPEGEAMILLEANIDDLDPRLWPGVLSRLQRAGAADAWLQPIVMKKGRPAHTLAVLAHPHQAAVLREIVFAETSTFGVRESGLRRSALPRCWVDVDVAGAAIPIKIAHRDGGIIQATPEFENVDAVAAAQHRPVRAVLDDALAAAAAAGLVPGAAVPPGADSSRPAPDEHRGGKAVRPRH